MTNKKKNIPAIYRIKLLLNPRDILNIIKKVRYEIHFHILRLRHLLLIDITL